MEDFEGALKIKKEVIENEDDIEESENLTGQELNAVFGMDIEESKPEAIYIKKENEVEDEELCQNTDLMVEEKDFKPGNEECRENTDEELLKILLANDPDVDNMWESSKGESTDDDKEEDREYTTTVFCSTNVAAGSSNETWSQYVPSVDPLSFGGESKLLVSTPKDPLDYFKLLASDDFFDLIVKETNTNAVRILSGTSSPRARIATWKELTTQELEVFLGLIFLMGLVGLPSISDYWRRVDSLYDFPVFYEAMSRDRFLIILRVLHFSRNPIDEEPAPEDVLYKVRPLLNVFINNMRSVYSPNRELSLDEYMLLWRGRLSFKQLIEGERHKLELYMLAESSGLILDTSIYTQDLQVGHTEKVVHELMNRYFSLGVSINLAQDLPKKRTYLTGTLKRGRKGNTPDVTNKKLRLGESIYRFSDNGVRALKWTDSWEVRCVSSEFSREEVPARTTGDMTTKPEIIVKYMGGIHRADKFLAYYPLERKTLRWYLKVGIHIVHIMANNSWILYSKFSPDTNKLSQKSFREMLATTFISKNKLRTPDRPLAPPPDRVHCVQQQVPKKRKRCRLCYRKNKNKLVSTTCDTCDTPLCIPCFREYHKY